MQNAASSRIAWVDHAKGLSIILVVMMHSTLGVELALGSHSFMGDVVAFAAAFRMPLFFMISGLFLARALERPWARYLDDKVLHFAYFYVLWSLIQIGIRLAVPNEGNHGVSLHDLLMIPLEPYGTIWFIYVLAVFFVVTRLLAAAGPAVLLGLAVVLNILPVPGLDGFGVIEPFLSYSARRTAARVRPWAPLVLLLLIIAVPGVSSLFLRVGAVVYGAVGGDVSLAFAGYSELLFWR